MATPKSPFVIVEDFLSPKTCEQIVTTLDVLQPDYNSQGQPIKTYRYKERCEDIVFARIQEVVPHLTQYYDFNYRATETIQFEYFVPGTIPEPLCENSEYIRKKWLRNKDRDITGVVFLSEYNQDAAFDDDFEVYGGKLEFIQHGFGFNPQRGTAVFYPSGPHFINATAEIRAGTLYQARVHIAAMLPYIYQPTKFPGNFTNWFK